MSETALRVYAKCISLDDIFRLFFLFTFVVAAAWA